MKVYLVTMLHGSDTQVHKFSADSKELAERSALIKYPFKTVVKVEEE